MSALRLERAVGGTVFGSDVAGYAAARIGYPPELYDAIRSYIGGDAGAVVEIGPGTGLATREILAHLNPQKLVAVEADPHLATHLMETIDDPRFSVIQSGFVDAEIPGEYDLACCAAAFHWLEPVPAFAKLRTLLKPGATLALWWNSYRQPDAGDAFADAVTPLLKNIALPPSEGEHGHYSLEVANHRESISAAGFVDFKPVMLRRERTLDAHQVRQLYASYSYIRALEPLQREGLLSKIDAIVHEQFGGTVENSVFSALYLARNV